MAKIEQAYAALKANKGRIDDVFLWLTSAIQRGYKPHQAVSREAENIPKKNSFTDYDQRDYDFDDLMDKWRKRSYQENAQI